MWCGCGAPTTKAVRCLCVSRCEHVCCIVRVPRAHDTKLLRDREIERYPAPLLLGGAACGLPAVCYGWDRLAAVGEGKGVLCTLMLHDVTVMVKRDTGSRTREISHPRHRTWRAWAKSGHIKPIPFRKAHEQTFLRHPWERHMEQVVSDATRRCYDPQ